MARARAGRRRPGRTRPACPAYMTPIEVGELGDQAHVVADQHDRRPDALLEPAERLHHLALDDHVEGAGRLVGDDHLGFEHGRDRHHRALLHAAAQLVGVAAGDRRPAGRPAELGRTRASSAFGEALALVGDDGVDDLVLDAHHGVERVHRALRHQRDVAQPDLAQRARRRASAGRGRRASPGRRRSCPAAGSGASAPWPSWSCRSRTRRSVPGAGRLQRERDAVDGLHVARCRSDRGPGGPRPAATGVPVPGGRRGARRRSLDRRPPSVAPQARVREPVHARRGQEQGEEDEGDHRRSAGPTTTTCRAAPRCTPATSRS